MNTTDMRCASCTAIGCECPRGYVADARECSVCGYRFILNVAACIEWSVRCPECRGTIGELVP